ncbi:hypothetical protein FB451DRAFT_1395942 [Mycena latifolia]|nr:hypothetical protein FB451DRAFT_1395942 [Mycena latifolia]
MRKQASVDSLFTALLERSVKVIENIKLTEITRRTLYALVVPLLPAPGCLIPQLEVLTIGGYQFADPTALVDMVVERRQAAPAVCATLRAFALLHAVRIFPIPVEDMVHLARSCHQGLELLDLIGMAARAAMLEVPFFHAGLSDGEYWSPEAQNA